MIRLGSEQQANNFLRLKKKVLEDAEKKAAELEENAKIEIRDIEESTEREIDYLENVHLSNVKEELAEQLKSLENELQKRNLRRVLEKKQELLEKLIKQVDSQLVGLIENDPEIYYNKFMKSLIQDALNHAHFPEYYLVLNPKDKEYIENHPDFLKQFGKKIMISDKCLDPNEHGCILEDKTASVRFDNRFSKKQEFLMDYLKTRLSNKLFQ